MVAKVAGGIIGIGLIGAGGVAFTKPEWLGINRETYWQPLSKDSGFSGNVGENGKYKDKFGGKHRNYFVGLHESNNGWWEESHKKLVGDNVGTGNFSVTAPSKKVSSAFSTAGGGSTGKSLSQVCEDAYKADPANVKSSPNTSNDQEFDEVQVWKYCSPLGSKPKTIKEAGETTTDAGKAKYSGNNIGKEGEESLISVSDQNSKFWEIREKEFKGGNGSKFEKMTIKDQVTHFKNGASKTIRQLCEDAYKKDKSNGDGSGLKTDEVKKYCSLTVEFGAAD